MLDTQFTQNTAAATVPSSCFRGRGEMLQRLRTEAWGPLSGGCTRSAGFPGLQQGPGQAVTSPQGDCHQYAFVVCCSSKRIGVKEQCLPNTWLPLYLTAGYQGADRHHGCPLNLMRTVRANQAGTGVLNGSLRPQAPEKLAAHSGTAAFLGRGSRSYCTTHW